MAAAGLKEGNGRAAPEQDRRGLSLIDGGRLPDETRVFDAVAAALLQPIHIDAANKNGDTALHAAALLGYDRVVKLLADKGANLSVKNSRGLTPLSSLTGRGDASTADLLRKLGAVE
jgi:hypothetical protein